MSHAHAARDGMSQPPPRQQQQQQTTKEEKQSKSKQPGLILQPKSTMSTTAKAQSIQHLPTIPSLDVSRGGVSCPSLQAGISSLSLDDASSSPSLPPLTPYRNRSHAIDLMGLDLSCLKCNDDESTGEHFLRAGKCKILHPPHHRKMSSSSCVAFAVEAALAEQDEAAMSEKAADDDGDDNDDDDSEIFGSDDFTASDLESEASRVDITKDDDDDFSFFQEYSCDCLDSSSVIANSRSDVDVDDDKEDGNTDAHPTATITDDSRIIVEVPPPPLPTSNTPRTPRKDTQRLHVSKASAELSPVSVADTKITTLHINTTSNPTAK